MSPNLHYGLEWVCNNIINDTNASLNQKRNAADALLNSQKTSLYNYDRYQGPNIQGTPAFTYNPFGREY